MLVGFLGGGHLELREPAMGAGVEWANMGRRGKE